MEPGLPYEPLGHPAGHVDQRSLAQLFSDLTSESTELMRKEIELARLEVRENVTGIKSGATGLAVGGPVLYAGFLVLLFAAALGVDRWIGEPWLSASIVGAAVVLVGFVLLLAGRRSLRKTTLKPERSVDSLRRDKEMVQRHVTSAA